MTELILRNSFNGVANYQSYGGKSLQENLVNAELALEKVKYTERIWDRSRSQWMNKFLTCSNADGWLRLRQISAEMAKKRMILTNFKFAYMIGLTEAKIKREEMLEEENENKRLLLEIDAVEKEHGAAESLIKLEGAMKEIEGFGEMHDQLKERLGDINEEAFEKAQTKCHIKRAVTQAVREVKEMGKIKCGNAEYLEQSGLSTTAVLKDIYIFLEKESEAGVNDTSMLHVFLDEMADKYEAGAIQQADWLGFDPHANKNLNYGQ